MLLLCISYLFYDLPKNPQVRFRHRFGFVLCNAECERWRRSDNVSAENGMFSPLSTVANCMDLCVSDSRCVAIDIWPGVCSLHLNADDLLSRRVAIGVSQFVLDRSCVSAAPTTSSETFFTTPKPTTGFTAYLCHYFSVSTQPFILSGSINE